MLLVSGWILVITLVNIIVYKLRQLQETNFREHNITSLLPSDPVCRCFSLGEIHSATRYFDEAFVIGKGGFGKVYRGSIDHGTSTVAIKRLDHAGSKQGATEFWTEIKMLSKFRHSHLVSLIGYCTEGNEMILVYEYISLGSLSDHLHKLGTPLTWVQRLKICIGAARGLDYLHTGTGIQHRVIHRDVKSSNILLDNDLEARISDFGLSKVGPANQLCTHVSTYFKGTFGYVDPDYLLTWKLTRKSDVYAFGVVLFEIICGRMAVDLSLEQDQRGLAGWAQHCVKRGTLIQIIDPRLRGQILTDCLKEFGQIAGQCLHRNPKKRPTMAEVVARLEYSLTLQEGVDVSEVANELDGIAWALKEEETDECSRVEKEENASNSRASDDQLKVKFPNNQESTTNGNSVWKGREQIDSIAPPCVGMAGQSPIKHAGIMTITRKLRQLLFGKARMNAVKTEQGQAGSGLFFTYRQVKYATQNFSPKNKIGKGGFGSVYKGVLPDGTAIAVKKLSTKSKQGIEEFTSEIYAISTLQHENLVKLIGYCAEDGHLLILYEYMENNSLSHELFGPEEARLKLDWPTRMHICLGIAKGLAFLHEESRLPIVHREVKLTNILLDRDLNPKISDFGFARFYEDDISHIITKVAGTLGYMAPEYAIRGHLTTKVDVYSFGVVILEIVSGKNNASYRPDDFTVCLLDTAYILYQDGQLIKLVDPALRSDYSKREAITILELALFCTNLSPIRRPTMSEVVKILKGESRISINSISETCFIEDYAMANRSLVSLNQLNQGAQTTVARPLNKASEGTTIC